MEEIVLQIPFSNENIKIIARYLKTYDNNTYYPLIHQYAMKQGSGYNVKDVHQMWVESTAYVVSSDVAKRSLQEMSRRSSDLNIINLKAMTEDNALVTIQDNKQVYVNKKNALAVFQILLFEKRWIQAFQIFKKHGFNKTDLIAQVKATPESIQFLHESGIDNETICLLNLSYGREPFGSDFKEPREGDIVVRGPDWRWDNQDGGSGNFGVIIQMDLSSSGNNIRVCWSNDHNNSYRMKKKTQDLKIIARRIDNKDLQIGDYCRRNSSSMIARITKIGDDSVINSFGHIFLKTDIIDPARVCESESSDSIYRITLFQQVSFSKVFEILPEFFPIQCDIRVTNISIALMAKNKWMLEHLFKKCDDQINWNGLDTLAFDAEYLKAVKAFAVSDEQRERLDRIKVLSSYKNPVVDAATLETVIKDL